MSAKKAAKSGANKSAKQTLRQTAGRASSKGGGTSPKKPVPRAAPRAAAPVLRPLPVFEFTAGGITGYLRLSDPGRGFEFCRGAAGGSLPAACREVLSLRHYLARGDGGLLAPREEAQCEGKVEKKGIVFSYGPTGRWPVEASARYQLLSAGGLDVTFAFDFRKELSGFEAGVETLLPRTYSGIHIHAGGRWTAAAAGPRLKRFYPRNLGAAELIADGRWSGLRRAGIGLSVEPQGYDYPLVLAWEPGSESALAWMALTEDCTSLWVNGADRTVGMGVGGSSMKAGASYSCRLRVVVCRISRPDDAFPYYREFVQQARAPRRR